MTCSMTRKLRTLVVDDSQDYLEAASRLLSTFPCIASIDLSASGPEAVSLIGHSQPDLVLIDIAMPGMNGLDLTRILKTRPLPPKVIIVTLHDTPAYRAAAFAAGADGFLGKSQLVDRLQDLINQVFPQIRAQSDP